MAWKTRGNRRYYYRSRRVGNRVVSEYCGGGLAGELAAGIDQMRRDKLDRHRHQVRELHAELQHLADDVRGFCCDVGDFTRASLVAGGYYQHRGNWRMRMTLKANHGSPLPTREDLNALVDLANQGHRDALEELRNTLNNHPEIWQRLGDLGLHVETALIAAICQGNALVRESLQRQLAEMKAELVSADSPLLERMAAQRIMVCWLELQMTDASFPEPPNRFILQRKQVAQNRFAKAIRTLDLVRQMTPGGRPSGAPSKKQKNSSERKRRMSPANRLAVFFNREIPVGAS